MSDEPPNKDKVRMMTYEECAKELGVSTCTMRRYAKKLKIPRVVMGHQIVRMHWPTARKYLEQLLGKLPE
jgi:predicted site-specific integrase-resolvase